MMSVHRGEVPCTGTTASPLEESFLSQGQVLKLEGKTDPSIMGRMIKYVDMSVKTKIQKLTRAMQEVV
uniref:Uncharacterized protein n=1 Tax=Nomascus leucogenys TaxID=61853 RepID=A0A2I3HHB9_NOMLE